LVVEVARLVENQVGLPVMRRLALIFTAVGVPLVAALMALVLWWLRGDAAVFRVTVVEGLTLAGTVESLAEQTSFAVEEFETALLDGTVTSDLLVADPQKLRDWEGLLFPDTYELTARMQPDDILQRLADTAESRVNSIDWSYLTGRGLTVYDGIVIASMIEREAAVAEDRPLISSVIHNRLEIGMLLQIDATVVYALGNYPEGGLTLTDLQVDSPYNTYVSTGLPPTPIAGPGMASLAAAASPAATEFLFYVLAGEDGSHAFAENFGDFLRLQEQAREDGILP
jgi:UPF0755 protein